MNSKRRKDFEILADILRQTSKGATKTKIKNLANLGYESFRIYWSELESKNLITAEEEEKHQVYKTTEKGDQLLKFLEEATKIWQAENEET